VKEKEEKEEKEGKEGGKRDGPLDFKTWIRLWSAHICCTLQKWLSHCAVRTHMFLQFSAAELHGSRLRESRTKEIASLHCFRSCVRASPTTLIYLVVSESNDESVAMAQSKPICSHQIV